MTGWLLLLVACGGSSAGDDTGAGTTADAFETEEEARCDGEILQICTDGAWLDDTDCAASGQMCHEEMGHCMTR